MSTIHLSYSSIKNLFDNKKNKTINLIYKNHKINDILYLCSYPKVICNIIFEYTFEKISLYCEVHDYNNYFLLKTRYFVINVVSTGCNIKYEVRYYDSDVFRIYMPPPYNRGIQLLNTCYELKYGIKKYIDCNCAYDKNVRTLVNGNVTAILLSNDIQAIEVFNYKKFKYRMVILKCIIQGIQKYFKKNENRITLYY